MRITSGGNVGIGTVTPNASMEINKAANDILKITSNWGGTGNHAYIDFLTYQGTGVNARIGVIDMGTYNGSIVFETGNTSTANGTITTEVMRLSNTGALAFSGAANYGTSGQVLTSNGNAAPSWQKPATNAAYGVLGAGVNIPYNTGTFLYTNATITLPPGTYAVMVNMLMTYGANSPNNSAFWLRTTFGDASTSTSATPDIIGSSLASGNLVGPSFFAMLSGCVIIKNSTGANKTYYYLAGNCQANNNTNTLGNFGNGTASENGIVAFQLQ